MVLDGFFSLDSFTCWLRFPWIGYTAILALNEAFEQCKNTQPIPLPAPNHSHESLNSVYKTLSLSQDNFSSIPRFCAAQKSGNLCTKFCCTKIPPEEWGCVSGCQNPSTALRLLLITPQAELLGQMEKPRLEQEMTAGAKSHLGWQDQDEINPVKMWHGAPSLVAGEGFVMQIMVHFRKEMSENKGVLWHRGKKGNCRKFSLLDIRDSDGSGLVFSWIAGNTNKIPASFPTALMTEGLNNH